MIENTKNVLPIHITGMENIKGQQTINSVLDSMNNDIDNHKWIITTQDYANLRFEKYIESGSILTVDQKPKENIPVVGTHNNRKVYIGDLDVQGNLIIKDLALRDNINTVSKTWKYTDADSLKPQGSLEGDWWNSESFGVGIREKKSLVEVKSIPNDTNDNAYGKTIYNGETSTKYGTSLDTRTYEKKEVSYFIEYPWLKMTDGSLIFSLFYWIQYEGWRSIGKQTYFPQITTSNAKACWSPGQYYGVFEWRNQWKPIGDTDGRIKLVDFARYDSYEKYYNDVASYPDTHGADGRGIMIPSWRAIENWYLESCTMQGFDIYERRIISEEFDKRNSGIVKVDVAYRI